MGSVLNCSEVIWQFTMAVEALRSQIIKPRKTHLTFKTKNVTSVYKGKYRLERSFVNLQIDK